MSKISADTVEAKTTNGDLVLQGNGTGVPDLATGAKLAGVALTTAFLSPTGDGSGLSGVAGGGLKSAQVITASGTWTKPAGINLVKVTVVGGGGGGAGGHIASVHECGTGGGGAGAAIKYIDVSAISSETVTVGAGGGGSTGRVNGSAGGTSSFGAHCSATGGAGGLWGTTTYGLGGASGTGSGGDINVTGQEGEFAYRDGGTNPFAGSGGDAALFFPGGNRGDNVASNYNGSDGAYGAGGGGGFGSASTTGGNGGGGIIIVEEYA